MSKWIVFVDRGLSPSGKTHGWDVVPKDGGKRIGVVYWYGPWRKYAFSAEANCVFEQDCLRDIAAFVETKTRDHREALQELKRI